MFVAARAVVYHTCETIHVCAAVPAMPVVTGQAVA